MVLRYDKDTKTDQVVNTKAHSHTMNNIAFTINKLKLTQEQVYGKENDEFLYIFIIIILNFLKSPTLKNLFLV